MILSCWSWQARIFAHKIKIYGNKGSPWRIPLEGAKYSPGIPLTNTKKENVEIHSFIQLIHWSQKPNFSNTFNIKFYFSLSYAFSIFDFIASQPSNHFLFIKEWKTSWANKHYPEYVSLEIKAPCNRWIILPNTIFKQLFIILEKSLLIVEYKLMGWKN